MKNFRLILDPPRSAALNMALDEFLMRSQGSSEAPPVLRFYSWAEPAYSAGYFQNVDEIVKRFQCEKKHIPVVRRLTGGGLVRHGDDITFSLSVKGDSPFFAGAVKDSYLKVNEALRRGMKPLYAQIDYADCKSIPSAKGEKERICFESPSCYDLLLGGKKIVGASQRRKDGAILHQSSIFLKGRYQKKNFYPPNEEKKSAMIPQNGPTCRPSNVLFYRSNPGNCREASQARGRSPYRPPRA